MLTILRRDEADGITGRLERDFVARQQYRTARQRAWAA